MLKTVPQLKTVIGGRLYGVFFLPSYGLGNSARLAGRCFFFQEDKISKRRFAT